jgi:hypothetical protein
MFSFYLKCYFENVKLTKRYFGFKPIFLFWTFLAPLWLFFIEVTYFLDWIFFPRLKEKKIVSPIFLTGHPRSGTTFIHRSFNLIDTFSSFTFADIVCPTLTGRKILFPIINYYVKKNKKLESKAESGHETQWNQVEEEDLLFTFFFSTNLITFFSPLAFSANPKLWPIRHDALFFQQKLLKRLKGYIQRQLYLTHKDRILLKMPDLIWRLDNVMQAFTDAQFIAIKRNPLDAIESWVNMSKQALIQSSIYEGVPSEALLNYYQRRVRASILFYKKFHHLLKTVFKDKEKFLVIEFIDVIKNYPHVVDQIDQFCHLHLSTEEKKKISSFSHTKTHHNPSLEDYGITRTKIQENFDPELLEDFS